ncbi:MAG: universal stress protein [Deltaproteobacteria bacterium]|nr:universal stress protein [Deltaproteobacteria bacterium]
MDTILCAVDFSSFTPQTVRVGARLAKSYGARLILFHSVAFPIDGIFASDRPERDIKARRLAREARQRLEALAAEVEAPCELLLADGDPVEALQGLVRFRPVDLVVTASRGIGGVERLIVGTVVERMVVKAACPILMLRMHPGGVQGGDGQGFARLLVGCALRQSRDPAVDFARRLALGLRAELHLLHVLEAPLDEDLNGSYEEIQKAPPDRIARRLEAVCPDRRHGERIFTRVYPGVPAEALRRCAREIDCDLIVVGVHRVGALKGALIGTTARQLLHKAPCSLLTVPESF